MLLVEYAKSHSLIVHASLHIFNGTSKNVLTTIRIHLECEGSKNVLTAIRIHLEREGGIEKPVPRTPACLLVRPSV